MYVVGERGVTQLPVTIAMHRFSMTLHQAINSTALVANIVNLQYIAIGIKCLHGILGSLSR